MRRNRFAHSSSGFMAFGALLIFVVVFSLTGFFTYNLIEPDGFFGLVVFLISWGVMWAIVQFVLGYVFVALAAIFS